MLKREQGGAIIRHRFSHFFLTTLRTSVLAVAMVLHIPARAAWSFSLPAPLPGETRTIPIIGSTVTISGVTDLNAKVYVNGRELPVNPDGTFAGELLVPLGDTPVTVKAVASDGRERTYAKTITAQENSFFLVGLADGTLNFTKTSETLPLVRDGHEVRDGKQVRGKVSYYLAGKVLGRVLLKSALDTDKATQEKLFTYIDPDKYYPIYGDRSTVVYDVNSQGRFYLLVNWNQSGLVVGNYQTQIGGQEQDNQLLTYQRTLYGGKFHLETATRTVYGDPVGQAILFAAEANQRPGHSELFATGGSLYYLRHRNLVEGSEQVRLEVRDKRSGIPITTIPQRQTLDYEIKYDEGRLLFKQPVLSVATSDTVLGASVLEGNPVFIVVDYEIKNQEAFPLTTEDLDEKTGGLRLSGHLGDHLRGGVTYVQEQKEGEDLNNHRLLGGDVTLKLGNFTKLAGELAHSTAESTKAFVSYDGGYDFTELKVDNLEDGSAARLEAHTSLGEYLGKGREFLALSAYWQRVDQNFSPVNELFAAGTRRFGAEVAHRLSATDRVRALYEQNALEGDDAANPIARDQLTAQRVQHLLTQWEHIWKKFTFTSEYQMRKKREALSPLLVDAGDDRVQHHLVGEQVRYDLSSKTSLYLGQQLGLTEFNDSFTTAGFTTQLSPTRSLRAQASAGPAGNSVLAGLEETVSPTQSLYMTYTLERSDLEGASSTTSFGANTKVSRTASLRTESQFVTSDTRGVYTADLLGYEHELRPGLNARVSYQRRDEVLQPTSRTSAATDAVSAEVTAVTPDRFKSSFKVERRYNSDDLRQTLSDNQAELKLTDDLFLFGEYEVTGVRNDVSRIDKKQVGLAYRPVGFDWFNALVKYIRFTDERPKDLTNPDGGFFQTKSTSDVFAGEAALDLPWHFQLVEKLAYKDEATLAVDPTKLIQTPDDLQALLTVHRLNYHLTNRIDVAGEFRALYEQGRSRVDSRRRTSGVLVEASYRLAKFLAIGLGYNFSGLTDTLASAPQEKETQGFFLRLQGRY